MVAAVLAGADELTMEAFRTALAVPLTAAILGLLVTARGLSNRSVSK